MTFAAVNASSRPTNRQKWPMDDMVKKAFLYLSKATSNLKVGAGLLQVEFLNPDVAIKYVMTLCLEFQAAWNVCDAFSTIIATVDTRVWTTPNLTDLMIGVRLLAIEV